MDNSRLRHNVFLTKVEEFSVIHLVIIGLQLNYANKYQEALATDIVPCLLKVNTIRHSRRFCHMKAHIRKYLKYFFNLYDIICIKKL